MTNKKLTRLQKSTAIMEKAKQSKWCYVNTDNEFTFQGETYVISGEVEEYKVHNKASESEDFTNEAYMEEILVVVDQDNRMQFYNQIGRAHV